ncbi:methyl-accepting chemotaxis protein [Pacificibacter marinus]|uniref:Methyl-accepting chemotaxis protein I n=1 Tax=Pacificibacter marinus TaxID=658057 RepID=A0A1Y5RTE7_9RHOB|nr:methyl-accepting chemotaxis protein [Pacificibacter marinus]SEK40808.1 methyl-accepting chemotaxis sensory transducer with Pas/Pac sensor [Pacificibacter marinus]SLN24993.1 Methyl-accepting chemotaxis protein I [Pacificibacter marinus]
MNFFKKIKLAQKLPIVMIGLTALAICISGYTSYRHASKALLIEAEDLLSTIAEARTLEFNTWLEGIDIDIRGQAESPTVLSAVRGLDVAWSALPGDPQAYLQNAYIDDNPNVEGEKHLLDFAEDGSAYSQVHKLYHASFRKLVDEKGYYDVFIFNTSGELIYSVFKERDFATNFLEGQYKETALGAIVRDSLQSEGQKTFFQDVTIYEPSHSTPASFIGSPIVNRKGETKGVIAFQMSAERIDAIMTRATGLGETGDAYIIGEDMLLRSDPIHGLGNQVLVGSVDFQSAVNAIAGETGLLRETVNNTAAGHVHAHLAAYRPLDFHGVRWALIAEQSIDEILLPANQLRNDMIRDGLIMILVVAAIAYFISRTISKPLTNVERSMRVVSTGDYSSAVPGTGRGDEIGGIANALDEFRNALGRAEQATRDGLFKGSAFEGSSAALMMVDQNFDVTYINAAASKLMSEHQNTFRLAYSEFDATNLVGANIDTFHKFSEKDRKVLEDPNAMPFAADIKVGETYFSLDINSVLDLEGKQIGCVLEWKDVTDIRTSEAVIAALDSNQAKAEFELNGKLIGANANFAGMTGTKAQDILGFKHDELFNFDPEMAAQNGPVWDRLLRGDSVSGRFNLKSTDGKISILDGTFSSVKDASGNPFRVILLGTDVTESHNALQASKASQEKMKAEQDTVVEGLRVALKRLAKGDLTSQIDIPFALEYETLRNDFNLAMTNLLDAMSSVVENADMIRGEASEISNAADDLSRRTEKQAATLEETATALDELTSSVKSAAEGANQASQMVASAKSNAEASGEVVQEAVEAMSEIESSSNQISKIISVIDDIAFQTNLLALNAGVEAARAGEAGRGFAVVASEVRALAQRSSEAAREINSLISKSGALVKRGVGLVGETGDALKGIVSSVSEIAINVTEIADSSREQSSGLAEINAAVNQLDQVTQQNAAMFEETTAASHALTREAENLNVTTSRFSISKTSAQTETSVVQADFTTKAPTTTREEAPVKSVKQVANAPQPVPQPVLSDDWEDF